MSSVVFRNGHVFDGEHFRTAPTDVVVTDGSIAEVCAGGQAVTDDSEVVDCAGRTVLPGFVDAHIHCMATMTDPSESATKPFSLQFYEAIGNLRKTLECGITTARDAGGADLGVKRAIEAGLIDGPRLKIAVSLMSQTGGHGDGWLPSGATLPMMGEHPGRPSGIADGFDEVRKKAREILRAGADQIKICSTGGVLSPTDDPRHSQFSRDEISIIVEEARAQGTYVMAHAQGTAGIENAVQGGVRSIEHGIYLTDDVMDMMREKGVYFVPTLVAPLAVLEAADEGRRLPEYMTKKARQVMDDHHASFARAVDAGLKIVMGTDSGVGPHGRNLKELELMAGGGMDLEEVLAATTSTAGELLGEPIGRFAAGYRGDVVTLDTRLIGNDQLSTIGEHIQTVHQDGVQVV